MLWIKSFHIIFVVTWFAGLFYLPRLFVYHANTTDHISLERFQIMERRLYRGIMTPSGVIATLLGLWLLILGKDAYLTGGWMHAKLGLVAILWIYHFCCGRYVRLFSIDANTHSATFYRFFNEFPALILVAVVILVVVKPF